MNNETEDLVTDWVDRPFKWDWDNCFDDLNLN